jgi:pimeloyl-ACP methyl ester carboxylesterase
MTGCVAFQTGPSAPLPSAERVVVDGRGQLRVIDRNPDGKEVVLLVHGYGGSSASYRPIIDRLAERYRVIAVDLPGFGRSDKRTGDYSPMGMADVLARVLDAKGIARAHVVGHSWGSSVVLAFALRYPTRLDRLVVASSFVFDDQLLPLFRWARASRGLGKLLYAMVYREAMGERLYLNFADPALVTEEVVDEVRRGLRSPGAVAAAAEAAHRMNLDQLQRDYRHVAAPTLVLWGREDRVALVAYGERLARMLPRARLVVLPQCGHIPMWECTGETAGAILEHLGGAP